MLDCTAMCRCMDKKPCGNIMESSAVFKLLSKAAPRTVRGGMSMNHNSTMEIVGEAVKRPYGIVGTKNLAASSLKDSSVVTGTSAAIAAPDFMGKPFAPLPGNRHRITGLVQRNSVVQERTTLSQAVWTISIQPEGATHRR